MSNVFAKIPTWEKGQWTYTLFETKKDFRDYVKSLFKVPGEYQFDETVHQWNTHARTFQEKELYCVSPEGSKDHQLFWDVEKEKCRKGVIYKNGDKQWYIPRDYYMWLNYLPIYDKIKGKFDFPRIWDSQYHTYLYILLAFLHGNHAVLMKKRQWGGLQPNSSTLLTLDGWKTFGELVKGEKIWNPDGTIQTVDEIIEWPNQELYEFEFIDGRKTIAGGEHNWYVLDKTSCSKQKWCVLTTNQILDKGYYTITTAPTKAGKKEYKYYKFAIPYSSAIPFEEKKLLVDPYVLGTVLGDGTIDECIRLATMDKEIIDTVMSIVGQDYYASEEIRENNKAIRYCIGYKYRKGAENPLSSAFKKLGLRFSNCYNKFIPTEYKYGSIEQRIALIQGLMDTDGYINASGKDINYTTVSEVLANDFAYVCRSLGLQCRIDKKPAQKQTHVPFYRVRISGVVDFPLFKLTRKRERQQIRKNEFKNCPIINITKLDRKEDSRCIVVSNPNKLYITNDYIVTHNTYLNLSRIINRFWFEEGFTAKMGASLKDYVNEKGAWKFLNQYRDFLNKNTAWYRTLDPERIGSWQQRQKVKENGRDSYVGLKSSINTTSFEKDATAGVGGNINMFYHEEAGIAKKMDETYEFMRPALGSGGVLTGQFVASGSVGDLDQCKPLKEFILDPTSYEFYGVETNLLDNKGTVKKCGLFIPEQWSYTAAVGEEEATENEKKGIVEEACIDEFGNSLVQKALDSINRRRTRWKSTLSAEKYQLRISQHPINIEEAFAIRKSSLFETAYVSPQIARIEADEYPLEYVELYRDDTGKVCTKPSTNTPNKFPTDKKLQDKKGVVVITKHPDKNAKPLFTYIGSVDSVAKGSASASDSLACIYIYEMPHQVNKSFKDGTKETFVEGGKIVAWWTGRFNDIMQTNEYISMLVEYYQAYTTCETNQSSWIDYMRMKRRTRFLSLREDFIFDKEANIRQAVQHSFGWHNTSQVWSKVLEYGINSLSTVTSCEYDDQENPINERYGVERIADIWLLKEMLDYDPKSGNFDRVIAYCALMAFAELRLATLGGTPTVNRQEDTNALDKKEDLYIFNRNSNPFHNLLGGNPYMKKYNLKPRSPFKHLH